MEEQAELSIKIMNWMLDIMADRSIRSSEFLSDMVRWGEEARKRAVTDRLIGLFNRRFLEEALQDHLQKARQSGHPLSLIMMDLDYFRQINQHYGAEVGGPGHPGAGARVPRHAQVRCGGDELAILLPGTSAEEAFPLSGRIC